MIRSPFVSMLSYDDPALVFVFVFVIVIAF